MLCEKCKANPVSVHLQQIINGERKDFFLCQHCAAQGESSISYENLFLGFLDSFIKMPEQTIGDTSEDKPIHYCPTCSLTYAGFKKTGKFGCSNCYNVFRNEISSVLKNIQGSNVHEGKFPRKFGIALEQKREIERLKLKLAKVIEKEEFEEAAKLRDKIKLLEKGDSYEKVV